MVRVAAQVVAGGVGDGRATAARVDAPLERAEVGAGRFTQDKQDKQDKQDNEDKITSDVRPPLPDQLHVFTAH